MLRITDTTALSMCAILLQSPKETIRIRLGRCTCLSAFLCVTVSGSASMGAPPTTAGTASSGDTLVECKDNKPMSAARGRSPTREDRRSLLEPLCPNGHVAVWEGGHKAFASGGRVVRLAFSAWLTRANAYSLTVELGTLWDGTIEAGV